MYSEFCPQDESASMKKPVKWLDVPIQKFNTAVPHFVELLKDYHNNIIKLKRLNNWNDVGKQYSGASKTANQLISLVNEMDTLRNQVADSDVVKFDKLICDSKQSALHAIQSHKAMSITNQSVNKPSSHDISIEEKENYKQEQQLQIVADLSEHVRLQEQRLASLDRIQEDAENINSLYQELSQLVHQQGEDVEKIENSVETAHHNVLEGESMLCQAAKYKNGTYPLMGALIGSVLGGPVGLVAGFKLGGLTAVACGLLGFTGGKILKNQNEVSINEADTYRKDLQD